MDPAHDLRLQCLEAARHALLRRLTLAMRHQLAVHLQPIGMRTALDSGVEECAQLLRTHFSFGASRCATK